MKFDYKNKNFLIGMAGMVLTIALWQVYFADTAYFTNSEKRHMFTANTVVISPVLTANAYEEKGFYDFYKGECNKDCLTVPVEKTPLLRYSSSKQAVAVFKALGYPVISDYELAKSPELLSKYDKVILLHSEYVTQELFEAVQAHDNVVYLYPNSLYGKVILIENCKGDICSTNGPDHFMRLVRGHNYDTTYPAKVSNGFDWYYDNSRPYEFDNVCKNWSFIRIDNGFQLNCYPEKIILKDKDLLREIAKVSTKPMHCLTGEYKSYPEIC